MARGYRDEDRESRERPPKRYSSRGGSSDTRFSSNEKQAREGGQRDKEYYSVAALYEPRQGGNGVIFHGTADGEKVLEAIENAIKDSRNNGRISFTVMESKYDSDAYISVSGGEKGRGGSSGGSSRRSSRAGDDRDERPARKKKKWESYEEDDDDPNKEDAEDEDEEDEEPPRRKRKETKNEGRSTQSKRSSKKDMDDEPPRESESRRDPHQTSDVAEDEEEPGEKPSRKHAVNSSNEFRVPAEPAPNRRKPPVPDEVKEEDAEEEDEEEPSGEPRKEIRRTQKPPGRAKKTGKTDWD